MSDDAQRWKEKYLQSIEQQEARTPLGRPARPAAPWSGAQHAGG
jgi:hypothetical protein